MQNIQDIRAQNQILNTETIIIHMLIIVIPMHQALNTIITKARFKDIKKNWKNWFDIKLKVSSDPRMLNFVQIIDSREVKIEELKELLRKILIKIF